MSYELVVLILVATAVQSIQGQPENATTLAVVETSRVYEPWNFLKDEINPLIVPVAGVAAVMVFVCLGWFCCFRHTHVKFCRCKRRERSEHGVLLSPTQDAADGKKIAKKATTILAKIVKYIYKRSPDGRYCNTTAGIVTNDMSHSLV